MKLYCSTFLTCNGIACIFFGCLFKGNYRILNFLVFIRLYHENAIMTWKTENLLNTGIFSFKIIS